jgi:flagellar basal-body rod modification protein FlgD
MEAIGAIQGLPAGYQTQNDIEAVQNQYDTSAMQPQQGLGTQPGGELGKNEFLNLLVTQLSNQDPLNPMDSTESIAQLAQFSALEQMQNISTQIQQQRHSSGILDAMLLQGQNVSAQMSDGSVTTGTIESATWMNDELNIVINNQNIPFSRITSLRLNGITMEEYGTEQPITPEDGNDTPSLIGIEND